jgi:hypothetical protein
MQWLRGIRVLALVLALALVATGCGGDDAGSDDATTTTASTSDGDGQTTTTTAATTTTEAESMSGDSGSEWCDRMRLAAEGEGALDFDTLSTPAEFQEAFEAGLELFEEAADIAPREIDEDVDTLLEMFRVFVDVGTRAEWAPLAMFQDPELLAAADDPALEAASDRIDAYNRDVCGVDFETFVESESDVPLPTEPASDDPVEILLGAFGLPPGFFPEEDIECMREELGPEFEAKVTPDYVPTTEDVALLGMALEACEISLG